MKKLALLFAFASFLLSACRPAEASLQNGLAQTETATAGEVEILSPAEMEKKGLVEGDAIQVKGEYEGIPVDVTFAVSEAIADRLPGYGLKLITPEGSELSGKERVMKAVLLAYFRLYREREYMSLRYLSLEVYPYEQFLADIKAGKDMGLDVYLVDPATGEGDVHQISPTTPLTLVATEQENSPNGNAPLYIKNHFRIGFYILPNDGVKIVQMCDTLTTKEPIWRLPGKVTEVYQSALKFLAWPVVYQMYGPQDISKFYFKDDLTVEMWEMVCPTDPEAGYCVQGTQIFQPRGK